MSADVDKIKDKLSIVEVVSSYVKLEKAGRTFKGKSPFNVERTPSFHVDPEKNLFHCFSSGKGGDIFTFIQEVENVDFQGALKILADKAGVTLTQYDGNKNDERSQLYEVLETATKLYEVAFRKDPEAIAYMEDRGLSRETMKDFRIGYAPAGWQYLVDALKAQGFPDGIIEKAGLGLQGKKGLYDRFRERIMFPIMDGQGKVVAFTGRIFVKSGSDTDPTKTGKYVNSPETPVYHKSKVLYGFDKARRSMMQENACIVVEGQMDLIMSHQAGVIHSVALSGTALTDDQVAMIQRFTDSIIFALDADKAGIAAVKRSIDVAYARDMATSVIAMKNTKDPADLVKEDPELWQQLVTKSVDYIDYTAAIGW
jgi:DNA primase